MRGDTLVEFANEFHFRENAGDEGIADEAGREDVVYRHDVRKAPGAVVSAILRLW